jgi:hypothetical protein
MYPNPNGSANARNDAHTEQSRLLAEARSDREAFRAQYAEQLAQLQRHADQRAAALNQALELARDTAQAYRAQLGGQLLRARLPTPTRPARPKRQRRTLSRSANSSHTAGSTSSSAEVERH